MAETTNNKKTNKLYIVLPIVITIILLISAIVYTKISQGSVKTPIPQTVYTVTKSTGLYWSPSLDASMKEEIDRLEIVEIVERYPDLHCRVLYEEGIRYELCLVRRVKTGTTGWVLRKWIR